MSPRGSHVGIYRGLRFWVTPVMGTVGGEGREEQLRSEYPIEWLQNLVLLKTAKLEKLIVWPWPSDIWLSWHYLRAGLRLPLAGSPHSGH